MNKKLLLILVGLSFYAPSSAEAHAANWAHFHKPDGTCSVEGYLGNNRFTADAPSCPAAIAHLKNNCPNCTSTPTNR